MIQPPPSQPRKIGARIRHLLIAIFWDPLLSLTFRWINIGTIVGVTGFYLFLFGQATPQSWYQWIIASVSSFVLASLAVRQGRIRFRTQVRTYSRFFAWLGRLLKRLRQQHLLDLLKQDVDILFADEAAVTSRYDENSSKPNVPASMLRSRRRIMRP